MYSPSTFTFASKSSSLGIARLDLCDEVLGALVLDSGFVDQIFVADRFARSRIEDLFLDLRVDRELVADLLREGRLAVFPARLLELVEKPLHELVIRPQQRDRIARRRALARETCVWRLACGRMTCVQP